MEQHQRRRHSEMDNIFQVKSWMEQMMAITKNRLDPNKALDVCKFACIFGTPTQPLKCDPWMTALLKGKPPTFENKLDAVLTSGVTQKYLQDNKATIAHKDMNHYKKVASRVRAVRGFSEWTSIHERISEEAPFSCLQGSPPRCPSKSCTTIQAGFDCMFSLGFCVDVWFAFGEPECSPRVGRSLPGARVRAWRHVTPRSAGEAWRTSRSLCLRPCFWTPTS